MTDIPLSRQRRCARRELAMRHKVYPRLVANKRMTQEEADEELAEMQAIVDTLTALCRSQQAQAAQTSLFAP